MNANCNFKTFVRHGYSVSLAWWGVYFLLNSFHSKYINIIIKTTLCSFFCVSPLSNWLMYYVNRFASSARDSVTFFLQWTRLDVRKWLIITGYLITIGNQLVLFLQPWSWCNGMGCASITWWRHQMETFSAILVHCAVNSPVNDAELWCFLWSALEYTVE